MSVNRTLLATAFVAVNAGPVAAQDWAGFYAGLSVMSGEADISYPSLPAGVYDTDDTLRPGIYAGYNWVLASNVVVGGELSYANANFTDYPVAPYETNGLLQVKARVGYPTGNVLPYLSVGVAQTEWGVGGGGPSQDETGYSLGLGAEFMTGSNMSIRGEYSKVWFNGVADNLFFPPDLPTLNSTSLPLAQPGTSDSRGGVGHLLTPSQTQFKT